MSFSNEATPWVRCWKPNPDARIRLFCLAYAGGGASVYRPWADQLSAQIEVCAIQLPGRENRLMEEPFSNLTGLVNALTEALLPWLGKPFAFFGHSLGALIGFEMSRTLEEQHGLSPVHLFVSGRRPPQMPMLDEPIYHLPDAEFLTRVHQKYGGIPDAVLADKELLELFLPILRADFTLAEAHGYVAGLPLRSPITAFGGADDLTVPHGDLDGWSAQTANDFQLYILPGGHFFLRDSSEQLHRIIQESVWENSHVQ